MSTNNNHNIKNQNNKEKKTVPPIKMINKNALNTSSQSNVSLTSSNEVWTITANKRNHSSSSTSESLNSPKTPTQPIKKKLFASRNRFEVFGQPDNINDDIQDTNNSTNNTEKINTESSIKSPPPIFVKGVQDFTELYTSLIEVLGVENFICKSSTDRLKIQTSTPETYRTLLHFLKDQNAKYHTYQLQQDKPTRVMIRNLHPTTQTSLIKSELELREFEVRNVTNVLH
uniref:Nucleic-acid-binding protein n=1 Tax=Sipha flava TaxID=143950 RepID=A0A2S2R5S3_9HEMI